MLSPNEGAENGGGEKPLVSAAEDAAYMDAVNRGDMETAAKMVREVAGRAMPNTKCLDEDGLPKVIYHGTPQGGFTEFNSQRGGIVSFTEDLQTARAYAGSLGNPMIYSDFVDVENPYVVDMQEVAFTKVPVSLLPKSIDINDYPFHRGKEFLHIDDFVNLCRRAGYDAVEAKNIWDPPSSLNCEGCDAIVTNWYIGKTERSGRIKSADPVTYDDDGNVIPLSRRFDGGDDIRGDVGEK